MKRFLTLFFLFLAVGGMTISTVGCMANRWGLLYDGRYTSSARVQEYADRHGLTYEEAFEIVHAQQEDMWGEVNERQQRERQPSYQQPPVDVTEAKQVEPGV